MARHASPLNHSAKRALIVLATASAALGAGVATASADAARAAEAPGHTALLGATSPAAGTQVPGLTDYAAVPLEALQYTPIAHTRVLPVDEGDLASLTGPLARTGPIGIVPVTEGLGGVLGGMAGMR
ncbi:hypothetical protein [Streptomyces alanosinicus]|uniref:Secreted protein n=1 Tax=Streptomyces alanosinicus TaxID=68171 RepID=A0A919D7G2_9ACTN|nr:hypothetical protein [Streptomyces alanosinicus]GHE13030.1 hypothetical protein GCM10010339_78600 [Streptomyces alanosinicus]